MEKGLEHGHGEYLPGDILKAVGENNMQLWILEDGPEAVALAATQIINYPRKKYLEIVVAATNRPLGRRFWRHAIKPVTDWSNRHGCAARRATGRPGWGRMMGWRRVYAVFTDEEES
jgi:hypothetical protein